MMTQRTIAATVAVAVMLVLVLVVDACIDALQTGSGADNADGKPPSRDAVYAGGATIIALAVFGSALGAGIIAGRNKNWIGTA